MKIKKEYYEAVVLLKIISANVDNTKLSDAEFRGFARTSVIAICDTIDLENIEFVAKI